jgi:hypothetical protein
VALSIICPPVFVLYVSFRSVLGAAAGVRGLRPRGCCPTMAETETIEIKTRKMYVPLSLLPMITLLQLVLVFVPAGLFFSLGILDPKIPVL